MKGGSPCPSRTIPVVATFMNPISYHTMKLCKDSESLLYYLRVTCSKVVRDELTSSLVNCLTKSRWDVSSLTLKTRKCTRTNNSAVYVRVTFIALLFYIVFYVYHYDYYTVCKIERNIGNSCDCIASLLN